MIYGINHSQINKFSHLQENIESKMHIELQGLVPYCSSLQATN